MRAIDLYAGIGGWSLGLSLAGIEVVRSYEWWAPAIDTHNRNHGGDATPIDIRALDLNTLPGDISLVVGSPPCTQFSYANRGGSGDIADGLKDLVRFLEVVERLKPIYWVMENVPRVADVLQRGFGEKGHPLYRFRHLDPTIEVLDMSTFGVPQARRRCIAGRLPFELIHAYQARLATLTLGDVVTALAGDPVVDPVWGSVLDRAQVTEMEPEPPLGGEELRMNREAKRYHPVYNDMAFPDDLANPSRTVTATCTRVSRESIVIADPANPGAYRRLTIRERACLQGFPITYQFYGRSFAEKAKMIGNAIPPPFTYLVASASLGVPAKSLRLHASRGNDFALPATMPVATKPNEEGRTYPEGRSFRAALPGLRFKSGMRFELTNHRDADRTSWRVRFLHGPSSDIREIVLDADLLDELNDSPSVRDAMARLSRSFAEVEQSLWRTDPEALQRAWSRREEGPRPYELSDGLGRLAAELLAMLEESTPATKAAIVDYVAQAAAGGVVGDVRTSPKLAANAVAILSGFIVGAWFNGLGWHEGRSNATPMGRAA